MMTTRLPWTTLVQDINAFADRYGENLPIAGQYQGRLANSGEQITLINAIGTVVQESTYDDTWYPLTDTHGHSLVIRDPNQYHTAADWQASDSPGGTPGH